jgi:branched-chain amino acid aminotransferase
MKHFQTILKSFSISGNLNSIRNGDEIMDIKFEEAKTLKEKPTGALGFGKIYTDYMFIADYDADQGGWHDARIVPFGPIELSPASMVLHYAQETFEGLKAYRTKDGVIQLFRPEMNARRFMNSNERLSMPKVPEDMFIDAVKALVEVEKDWVPNEEGESLYIRPYMFATEASVGVHPATSYKFVIICSPVGAYYPEGVNPVKIWVEDEYVRATPGGTGFTKCGGNYAGSLKAQEKAEEQGYTQVLWLDGVHKKYVEEVGSMNAMFVFGNTIVTAPIDGTVLPGVTRDSIIHLLKDWGYTVEERHMPIDELMEGAKNGKLTEAFGTGTAAVISPIGELCFKGEKAVINDFKTGDLTQKLYDTLTGIQWGNVEDPFGWTQEVVRIQE